MSKPTPEKSAEPLSAEEVVKALSYHGTFLKKHVLAALHPCPAIRYPFLVPTTVPTKFSGKKFILVYLTLKCLPFPIGKTVKPGQKSTWFKQKEHL
jgi:hypothetical protein